MCTTLDTMLLLFLVYVEKIEEPGGKAMLCRYTGYYFHINLKRINLPLVVPSYMTSEAWVPFQSVRTHNTLEKGVTTNPAHVNSYKLNPLPARATKTPITLSPTNRHNVQFLYLSANCLWFGFHHQVLGLSSSSSQSKLNHLVSVTVVSGDMLNIHLRIVTL